MIALLASSAWGYELYHVAFDAVHVGGSHITLEMDDPTLSSSDVTGINSAVALWDTSALIDVDVVLGSSGVGFPNFSNEIARSCAPNLVGTAPAATIYIFDYLWGQISEADIYVCAAAQTTSKGAHMAYAGGTRALVPIMLHELGHAIGLQHENDVYNIMGDDSTFVSANGNALVYYVGADATAGAADLYGAESFSDAGISHHRWSGRDGEYSLHSRGRVFDAMGRVRPVEDVLGEPRYVVWPSQISQVELTVENNGNNAGNVNVLYYFSTDNNILSTDTLLNQTTIATDPGDVITDTFSMTVPSTTLPGNYHLGARVDAAFTDSRSTNDGTYTAIRVVDTWAACTVTSPCGPHIGDCDSNAECLSGTTCVLDVGATYGLDPSLDVCQKSVADFCSSDFPCLVGEGDCEDADDCQLGNCMTDYGPIFGYDTWVDVCWW